MKHKTYLARLGKITGPYSETEIQSLRTSGAIQDFRWIWDTSNPKWIALDPAPTASPHLSFEASETRVSADAKTWESIQALFQDQSAFASGSVLSIEAAGCTLQLSAQYPTPTHGKNSRILLNLYDTKREIQQSISVKIIEVLRQQSHWAYQVQWDECPEILLSA